MRKIYLIPLFLIWAFSALAHAQTDEIASDSEIIATPREVIVEKVLGTQELEEIPELRGVSEPDIEIEVEPEAVEIPEVEEIEEEIMVEESQSEAEQEPPALVPFFASASDYLGMRDEAEQAELVLVYEITTTDIDGEIVGKPQESVLRIGPDYVSAQRGKVQKIYDFKLNRYLEVKPQTALGKVDDRGLLFDNVSLFAKAYRSMKTVLAATDNGNNRSIKISDDADIDAFWLESSMSWAALPLKTPPAFNKDGNAISVDYADQTVFAAKFSDETFESDDFKNALFAYAHHSWPLHPSILLKLYNFDAPPEEMQIVSYGPRYPKGQKQIWVLKKRELIEAAGFPLPSSALSAPERQPVSPLVFIINEAANNRALGGIQSPEQIEGDFETALKAENKMAQWLAGQKYVAYTGMCKNPDESWLCGALNDLTESNKFASISEFDPKNKKLSDFISAVEMARTKKTRATALNTLQPYLDDPDVPAIVLRTAAMARAGMTKSAAVGLGLDKVQADALLKRALATDPYDPETYLGLAQVYAAKGAYEQSWDIYDALRFAVPTVSAVELKIGTIEDKLRVNAAGYFLTD